MNDSHPRKHLTLERKRALLERYRRSCETQGAFCEGAGVSVSALQNWLKQERCGALFAEVVPPKRASTTVELVFPDGTALRVWGE